MSAGQLGGAITRRSVTPGGRLTIMRHSWREKRGVGDGPHMQHQHVFVHLFSKQIFRSGVYF